VRLHGPVIGLLIIYGLSGCSGFMSGSRQARFTTDAFDTRCEPPSAVRHAFSLTDPFHGPRLGPRDERDMAGLEGFSRSAVDIADIIGVLGLIKEIRALQSEARRSDRAAVQFLRARQQLSDRIALASFDVSSVTAEVECEETRTDHLADGLAEVRSKKEEIGLLVAIVGDALIGVVAGGLGLAAQSVASEITAIFGGALAAGFGTAAIFVGGEHEFRHQRNLLRDIWEGPAYSTLFPPSVWRYLNWPPKDSGQSIRDRLVSHWGEEGRLGRPGKEMERRKALFFGDGGVYAIEELRIRAEMLDQLKADVNLMSQDLNLLLREILALEAASP
jgi:hypothetical protein